MEERKPNVPAAERRNTVPTFSAAALVYSAAAILLFTVCSYLQQSAIPGLAATELILFSTAAAAAIIKKYRWKETFRIQKVKPFTLLLSLFCAVAGYLLSTALGVLNILFIRLLFGSSDALRVPTATSASSFLLQLLVIAGFAGVCEELLFRGFIQKGLERRGAAFSIICTGVLFGLFHFDITKLLPTAMIGMLFAFVAYRSGSVFCGMLMHFTNNAIVIVLGIVSQIFVKQLPIANFSRADPFASMSGSQLGIIAAMYTGLALLSGGMLTGLLFAFVKVTEKPAVPQKMREPVGKGLLLFLPGLLMILYAYGMQIAGFVKKI